MRHAAGAFALTLATGLALYPAFISLLARLRAGQRVAAYGPGSHAVKEGTATMGGLLFCALAVLVWLLFDRSRSGFVAVFALSAGASVGLLDDLANIRGTAALGLHPRQKLVLQCFAGALVGIGVHAVGLTHQWIPRFGSPNLGWGVAVLAAVALVACSNAVNLTDGVDGLAASCSIAAFTATGMIGLHQHNVPAVVISAGLVGALCAFLVFNWFPARVFMGDTGALALGSALVVVSAELGLLWLLPLLGLVFLAETLSVIVNVTAITRFGRHVLRASPLHHHFELLGLGEQRLVPAFAAAAVAGAGAVVLLAVVGQPR
ncbi:MAG: phospho-N-acetylmuramoyl-pentapeptide-transferase [Candidatus Dormibacteria bacterium]